MLIRAGAGDTIYVHAGTYVENVDVNKSITLIGGSAAPSEQVNKTVNLTYIGNYDISGIWDLEASGNYVYVTNGSFNVFNVSNSCSPRLVYTINDLGSSIAISGNYAHVTGANLSVIDINNPDRPVIVGNYGSSLFQVGSWKSR